MLNFVGIIYHNVNLILKLTYVTKRLILVQIIKYHFNFNMIIKKKHYFVQEFILINFNNVFLIYNLRINAHSI